jgi:hypothetical protein
MPYWVVTVVMRALCHRCTDDDNSSQGDARSRPVVASAIRTTRPSRLTAVTDESAVTGEGIATDANDWRLTVGLRDGSQADRAAEHLSAHQVEGEVQRRLGGRVVVGTDGGDELFLYARSKDAAAAAQESVSALLAGHGMAADYSLDRWHPVAEEWEAADIALPATAAELAAERQRLDAEETSESLASGIAMFEIRVQLPSHRDSVALAGRLRAEGYSVVRRWRFLVVGANNADQAEEFAAAIRQQAPAGAIVSTEEVGPGRPYTAFEIAAGSGI